MAKPIKITIKGTDNHGDDAPRVEDLLEQIHDQVEILREVESAIAGKMPDMLDWRVTNVTKNSPIAFEIAPYPKSYGMNVDKRASEVIMATARGWKELERGGERPKYFNGKVLKKIAATNKRLTNGLISTELDFSEYEGTPNFSINRKAAWAITRNIENLETPTTKPYRELGSIEGHVKNVGRDGSGRPFVILTARLDNSDVNCTSSDSGLDKIGHLEVKQVIEGLRLRVYGILHYKALGVLKRVDVERVELFPDESELPTIEDLIDPDFTNGVDSVQYIRRLRDDV